MPESAPQLTSVWLARCAALACCAGLAAVTACSDGESDDGANTVDTRDEPVGPRPRARQGGRPVIGVGGDDSNGSATPTPADAGLWIDASVPSDPACSEPDRPVDVIFVIDTSGSMAEEIAAIERNINERFAEILDGAGVDYRVIVLGEHGASDASGLRICIAPPLSGAACEPVPARPSNTERFRHYSAPIASTDSLCRILDTFQAPDDFALAPLGWSSWLREGALKVFVEITDDSADCSSFMTGTLLVAGDDVQAPAEAFDTALRQLAPQHFEADGVRDYRFYGIVGVARSAGPREAIVDERCSTAPTPGTAYQELSRMTGAMRYPVCEGASFPQAFADIAREVTREALPCQGL